MRPLHRRAFVAASMLVLLDWLAAVPATAATATRKSVRHGVTVAVTPGALDTPAPLWEFAVSFHSEGRPLREDMLQAATLVAGNVRLKPLAWDGQAATREHHRAGVLRFLAVAPMPETLEVHIRMDREASARVFRWDFGGWYADLSPARGSRR